MYTVQFNLLDLVHDLQKKTGRSRRYSWAEIGKEANIHRTTLRQMASNSARRVDLETLEKLVVFFREQGMHITVCDLFAEVETTSAPSETQS
jgi:hypothetical protein